jgi:hypothetical protein
VNRFWLDPGDAHAAAWAAATRSFSCCWTAEIRSRNSEPIATAKNARMAAVDRSTQRSCAPVSVYVKSKTEVTDWLSHRGGPNDEGSATTVDGLALASVDAR